MASSPVPPHSRSGYSAGPSRLRVSQSYPNLGRQASSSATPGPGPSSTPRKNHFNLVRPGVSYIKFRSSSSVPSRPLDQFSKDQQELKSKLKNHFERIQVRYREFESDDEVDLWSMQRYTPDGKVEAWRPDGRLAGDDDDDDDEDGDDENEDEDGGEDEDDGGDDEEEEELNHGLAAGSVSNSGAGTRAGDGESDSEDELCDWAEQEAAVRKGIIERQAYFAKLNDPFLSDALDEDGLTAQFFLDEAKRRARSERERSSPSFRRTVGNGRPRARTNPIESTTAATATAPTVTPKATTTATVAAAISSTMAHGSRVQSEPPKKVKPKRGRPPKTISTMSSIPPAAVSHALVESPAPRRTNKIVRPRARTSPIESTITATTTVTAKTPGLPLKAPAAAAASTRTAHGSRIQSEPAKKVKPKRGRPPKTISTMSSIAPVDEPHAQVESPAPRRTIKIARPRAKTNPIESTSTSTSTATTTKKITPKATATATMAGGPNSRSPKTFSRSFDVVIPLRSRSRTFEPETDAGTFDDQGQSSPEIRPQRLDFGVQRRPRHEPEGPARDERENDDDNASLDASSLPPSSPPPDLPDFLVSARPIRPLPSASYRHTPLFFNSRLRYPLERFDLGSDHSLSSVTPPLKSSMRGSSEMSTTPRTVKRARFSIPPLMSSDVLDDPQEDHLILLPRSHSPSETESEDDPLLLPRALSLAESDSEEEEEDEKEVEEVVERQEEVENVEEVEEEEEEEDPESSDDELLLVGPGSSSYRSSSTPLNSRRQSVSTVQSTPAKRPIWSPESGRLPPHLVRQYASSPTASNRHGLMLPPPVPLSHLISRSKQTPLSEPRPRPSHTAAAGKRSGTPARARSRSMTEERVIKSIQLGGITFKTVTAW